MQEPTVLIVQRNPLASEYLAMALKASGLTVASASDTNSATELLASMNPDTLIVTPDEASDFSFLVKVRRQYPHIRIVAIADGEKVANRLRRMRIENVIIADEDLVGSVTDMVGYSPSAAQTASRNEGAASVLIVEDDADSRELYVHYLNSNGYTVFSAGDGKEAVRVLEREWSVDVVLLDLMMPGMGGMETLKAILQLKPAVGVIMMSALSDNEIAAQAVKSGAYDYLLKPFSLELLDETITACLAHIEYQKQPWWRRIG